MKELNLVAGDEFVFTATSVAKLRFEVETDGVEDGMVRNALEHRDIQIRGLRSHLARQESLLEQHEKFEEVVKKHLGAEQLEEIMRDAG